VTAFLERKSGTYFERSDGRKIGMLKTDYTSYKKIKNNRTPQTGEEVR
jgi:hypothetical protein